MYILALHTAVSLPVPDAAMRHPAFFHIVICWWHFIITVQRSCRATPEFVQSLVSFWLGLFLCSGCVPCSSSAHRTPGKKAVVPIYKVLVKGEAVTFTLSLPAPKRTHLPLRAGLGHPSVHSPVLTKRFF